MIHRFEDYELDDGAIELRHDGERVHVEPQVFDVLSYLVSNRDRVVSKEELLDQIWGDRFVSETALTSRLKAARRAVGDDGRAQRVIRTVHGRGYQFVAEAEVVSRGEGAGVASASGADRAGRQGSGSHEAAAVPSGETRVRLPVPAHPILGREAEAESVDALLDGARMVTIVGPGGTGKTRLSLEVANARAESSSRGVVFVELAPARDGGDVIDAVGTALRIQTGQRVDLVEACGEYLAAVPHLLVIDNCEQVLAGSSDLVGRLLQRCPDLMILATSREPLGVAGEQVFRLEPLVVPDGVEELPIDEASDVPVLALFADRARRSNPDFVLTSDSVQGVTAICRSLDGLPLAVELAAGRLAALDLDDLRSRLDRRLDLIGGGRGAAGERHRTLRATIEWSYGLLDDEERRLFRFVSIFPAGVTLDAAESLGESIGLRGDPAGAMARLVEASMVRRVSSPSGTRYRQLETVRAYGVDRLEHDDEWAAAAAALMTWARDFAGKVDREIRGPNEIRLDDRVRRELPNIRAARAEMLARGDVAAVVGLSRHLDEWCRYRGVSELWRWQAELVGLTRGLGPELRGPALTMAAVAAWLGGHLEEAPALVDEALEIAVDNWTRAHALGMKGNINLFRGNLDEAMECWLERHAIDATAVFDLAAASIAAAYAKRIDRAREIAAQARSVAERAGVMSDLAWVDYCAGEIEAAAGTGDEGPYLEAAIDAARRTGSSFVEGVASVTLVSQRARAGDVAFAIAGYRDLIEMWLRTGSWTQQWTTLRNVAELLVGHDDETAVRVWAAARADPFAPALDAEAGKHEAALRAGVVERLGPDRVGDLERQAESAERTTVAEAAAAALDRMDAE